jgi:phage tail sheath gpL-like
MCRLRAVLLIVTLGAMSAMAQPETYKIRLAPVAADIAMREYVAGSGLVTATLAGNKLTLSGTFEGLKGNATVAHIHQGSAVGVRGAEILTLTVTKATSGNVAGSFALTADQVQALKKGRWYVQIDSEKTTEGNLWGWIWK